MDAKKEAEQRKDTSEHKHNSGKKYKKGVKEEPQIIDMVAQGDKRKDEGNVSGKRRQRRKGNEEHLFFCYWLF